MKKAAIYCRLSEEDKNKLCATDDSGSIQNQKAMLVQYAEEQGWEVYQIYSDDDYTGADRRRPQFKRLLKDAEQHKFDIILCKTQSRFTRELELVEKYISQKTGVRHNTRSNYNFVVNVIKKEDFGQKRIDKIKVSDAKEWLIKMQQIDGRGYSSIHTIRGVVRPAFQMAVDDDLLVKNPFEFQLNTVVVNDSVTREAITRQQERDFLEFVKNDKHFCKYYDGIYILHPSEMD